MRRHRRVAMFGAVSLFAGAGLAGVALIAAEPASAASVQLFSSGTPDTYTATVPANVCFVTVTAAGGQGGSAFNIPSGGAGGAGAAISARVAVTPGTLSILVGGSGDPGEFPGRRPGRFWWRRWGRDDRWWRRWRRLRR